MQNVGHEEHLRFLKNHASKDSVLDQTQLLQEVAEVIQTLLIRCQVPSLLAGRFGLKAGLLLQTHVE